MLQRLRENAKSASGGQHSRTRSYGVHSGTRQGRTRPAREVDQGRSAVQAEWELAVLTAWTKWQGDITRRPGLESTAERMMRAAREQHGRASTRRTTQSRPKPLRDGKTRRIRRDAKSGDGENGQQNHQHSVASRPATDFLQREPTLSADATAREGRRSAAAGGNGGQLGFSLPANERGWTPITAKTNAALARTPAKEAKRTLGPSRARRTIHTHTHTHTHTHIHTHTHTHTHTRKEPISRHYARPGNRRRTN